MNLRLFNLPSWQKWVYLLFQVGVMKWKVETSLVIEKKEEGSYKYEEFDNVEKLEGEGDGDGQKGKTIVISLKNEGEGNKA